MNWSPPVADGGAVEVMNYKVFYDSVDNDKGQIDVNDTIYEISELISNSEYLIQIAARGNDGREGIKTDNLMLLTRE